MKKLDNIVVESLNTEHGKEVIKTFRDLGINTTNRQGFCCKSDNYDYRYYGFCNGMCNGEFSNHCEQDIKISGAKIITLEQLKAMKEDKSEYPKLMYVGDDIFNVERSKKQKDPRVVFMKKRGMFLAWESARTIEDAEKETKVHSWKYAQDIEETPGPKQEEKTKVEFTGSLCMGDFREKTMTFLIDGDIELNSGRYLITKID